MLEAEVYEPKRGCEDDGSHHHQQCGALELLPSGPGGLLDEFYIGLFQVVDKLSHFYF